MNPDEMHEDVQLPEGPEVESGPPSSVIQRWLNEPDDGYFGLGPAGARSAGGVPHFASEDRHPYRPSWRPPVPIITVLDDGADDKGEMYRLRHEITTIGRSAGDIQIPNDPWISARHAEIRRAPWQGGYQWILHDSGSSNGTFVRCTRAILHETAVIILGARRFRLQNPLRSPVMDEDAGSNTRLLQPVPEVVWPELVEVTADDHGLRVPLRRDVVMLGRSGQGADIEIDDPLLAYRHATLRRQQDGTWLLIAQPTRNGVWISVTTVQLTSSCRFRCGEQQFWFVIP